MEAKAWPKRRLTACWRSRGTMRLVMCWIWSGRYLRSSAAAGLDAERPLVWQARLSYFESADYKKSELAYSQANTRRILASFTLLALPGLETRATSSGRPAQTGQTSSPAAFQAWREQLLYILPRGSNVIPFWL